MVAGSALPALRTRGAGARRRSPVPGAGCARGGGGWAVRSSRGRRRASPPQLGRGPWVTSCVPSGAAAGEFALRLAAGSSHPAGGRSSGDQISGAGVLRPTRRLDPGAGVWIEGLNLGRLAPAAAASVCSRGPRGRVLELCCSRLFSDSILL